ncbi:12074_t:CDS:2, partial [Entrophospora sp. SA101]
INGVETYVGILEVVGNAVVKDNHKLLGDRQKLLKAMRLAFHELHKVLYNDGVVDENIFEILEVYGILVHNRSAQRNKSFREDNTEDNITDDESNLLEELQRAKDMLTTSELELFYNKSTTYISKPIPITKEKAIAQEDELKMTKRELIIKLESFFEPMDKNYQRNIMDLGNEIDDSDSVESSN